jgi:subtilisin family serine protease
MPVFKFLLKLSVSIALFSSANASNEGKLRGGNVTRTTDTEINKFINPGLDKVRQGDGDGDGENRYVVRYSDEHSVQSQLLAQKGASGVFTNNTISYLPRDNAEIRIMNNVEEVEEYENRADVKYVEKDQKVFLQQDQTEVVPYGINLVESLNVPNGNVTNRRVCIIDTGYDKNHPDLPSAATGSTVTGVAAGDLDPFKDGNGHGTHVAGTIAAVAGNNRGVVGVIGTGKVNIHIVRVFNDNGQFVWASSLVSAVEECVDAGSNVINMSLGGGFPTRFEREAYERIYENDDVLIVAAAGNGGSTRSSYPASYDPVISVAAVDSRERRASFSQRNDQVELAAPGVDVLSTIPGGNNYAKYSGTSMACPHVAGVAALIWSNFPDRTAKEIRAALRASAKDLGANGRDNDFGYGLVRADRAYAYLNGGFTLNPTEAPTVCSDVYEWHDSRDTSRSCNWYGDRGFRCRLFGGRNRNDGYVANEACCVCGGGNLGEGTNVPTSTTMTPPPSPTRPSLEPSTMPTSQPTSFPSEGCIGCSDEVGWSASIGGLFDCEWFSKKTRRCRLFGNLWENNKLVANTACCACKNCGDLQTLAENIFQEHGGH